MFDDEDYIQINTLQHYVYCPRQCALLCVENVWNDNLYTVRGEILHEVVDSETEETRGSVRVVRGLRIHSTRLRIVGKCDVVEFHLSGDDASTLVRKNETGSYTVIPVEYKAGEPKEDLSDKVQLCAQALCLEEMLNVSIEKGIFFYGKIRRRYTIDIDRMLREQTEEVIQGVHALVSKRVVPRALYSQKCRNCSLESICVPRAMNEKKLHNYIHQLYHGTEQQDK